MNGFAHRISTFWLLVTSLIFLSACQSETHDAGQSRSENCSELASRNQVDQQCAIELAQQEISRREGKVSSSYSRLEARLDEASATWAVTAIYEPETPGGHILISIGRDGRVLDYVLGE